MATLPRSFPDGLRHPAPEEPFYLPVGDEVAVFELPALLDRLLDESGDLRKFVNVFVDDDDVRYLEGLSTSVSDGVTVSIIPAVAESRRSRRG